ncbi:LD-carboxypeptidase [Chloroflexia bacterium SDU3-3]|nr:LD-carboxypeptidase [Chloroflexia bacterium SDU3-3]
MTQRMYITCPSYALTSPTERAKYLRTAKAWAELVGFEIVPSPLLERYQAPGSWVPAELRAQDIRAALQHEIVWAARGGYGAVELVPALAEAEAAGQPLLIGYSDTTVLHASWLRRGWGPALYGTLAESIGESRQAQSARATLTGQPYACSHASEAAARVLRPGAASAPIFAACLVVLANLAGTPAMPSLRGKILAIEDVGERPYAIDFALHQLQLSGALDGIVGLLGGSFSHTPPADYGGPTMDELLAGWGERLGVPTVSRLPFGHMDDPMVVTAGTPAELEARADGGWSLVWQPALPPRSAS